MKSALRIGVVAAAAIGPALTSLLSIASPQVWSQSLIGDGLAAEDDPGSPYYSPGVPPPSWQGRPYALPRESGIGWRKRYQ
jgi:hypothetical protein